MPSQRQVRYGEVIRSIISEALSREFFFSNNDDVKSITVSYVRMSKDLRKAYIFVMPLGGSNKNKIIDTLNNNKVYFQKSISNAKLKSKFTPKIVFFLDDTFDEAEKIEKLLLNKNVARDLDNE